ncbi:MAG TPA: AprI/Inh family metalloprotease inhibitor [Caulobacteraceae bacterium]|nr:AprI/Inh family metalloprotease inhibitor [Caulobacteraceae bacterium]
MRGLALTAFALMVAGAGHAAVDTAALRPAGDWRLSEVGGKVACTLTFTRQTSFAGFELKAPLACRRAFPALKSVAAWALDDKGGIVLSDARAQPIITFPVQPKGPYEARAPDGRTWRLEPIKGPAAAPDQAPIEAAPPAG